MPGPDPASRTAQLASAFVARTLPKKDWTHEAHLRVGLWHVAAHGEAEALALLRARIRALNEAHGTANDDRGGYHETITRFYARRIAVFLQEAGTSRPIDDLADELVALCGDRRLALRYWSEARLMSVEARRGWVEPDLAPLP